MAYVSQTLDEEAPTVLIVESNVMSIQRLSSIFKIKEFNIEICQDGDKAVDEYIRLDPELVIISLDIPTLDGHLAALEMREHGGEARIVFVAPKRLAELSRDAAFSVGAVACIEKPITVAVLEEQWEQILGPIPEAPGLADLDQLYPEERIKIEQDDGPLDLPALPNLDLPPLDTAQLPPLDATLPPIDPIQPAKSGGKKRFFVLILLIVLSAAGYYAYSSELI